MKKRSFIAVWLLALVAIACALLVYENDLLWKVQEMNLFLNTSLYFKQQMVVSGGLLTYLGTFFTQFLHYPALGVALLCAWWLLLMGLVKHTFQVPGKWAALMLIPVALLLLTIVDMSPPLVAPRWWLCFGASAVCLYAFSCARCFWWSPLWSVTRCSASMGWRLCC